MGFSQIEDLSGYQGGFMIDFVATSPDGRRALVDVTAKLAASVPGKARVARALGMPLSILHLSARDPERWHHLAPVTEGRVATQVPMALIHRVAREAGLELAGAPDPSRTGHAPPPRVELTCQTCGGPMLVVPRRAARTRFCSRRCVGLALKARGRAARDRQAGVG